MTIRTPTYLNTSAFQTGQTAGIGSDDMRDFVDSSFGAPGTAQTAKTTGYTAAASDVGTTIPYNSSSTVNHTVNNNVFVAEQVHSVRQLGTGVIQFVAGSGVTFHSSAGADGSTFVTRTRYSAASITALSATVFYLDGDITIT